MSDLTITRITNRKVFRRNNPDTTVWSCCKECNKDIPQSTPENAYCSIECKQDYMAKEMGFAPQDNT